MTDYKYSGVWVEPYSTDDILVLVDSFELQLFKWGRNTLPPMVIQSG